MNDHLDLKNLVLRGLTVTPQSVNGTVSGTGINLRNGGAEVCAVINFGTISSGLTSGTVTLQSSLNDNTADAYAAADAYAQIGGSSETTSKYTFTAADAGTQVVLSCHLRNEKFVRAVVVSDAASLVSVGLETPAHIVGAVQTASA